MQYTITNSDWAQISQAGESCSLWLDQQNDGAIGLVWYEIYGVMNGNAIADIRG